MAYRVIRWTLQQVRSGGFSIGLFNWWYSYRQTLVLLCIAVPTKTYRHFGLFFVRSKNGIFISSRLHTCKRRLGVWLVSLVVPCTTLSLTVSIVFVKC